ncbi:DEAD/DEAH box helicase family protein [Candidatus Saccharibacteria bacterium]|nr:DEAD/DEAH box helicase family protein [Candidatus Saccharibacteria bacterium]
MNSKPTALYEDFDSAKRLGVKFPDVPKHIRDNLRYELRPYQEEAISRWLHYMDFYPNKKMPVQLLFNMATGSGKTLIMAAQILDLYKRGYRNFIYFVNSTNIIEKTISNFADQSSNKYLFTDNIIIDGENVKINPVSSFNESDDNSINIVFTTIQGLHSDLNTPRENKLSYSSFEDESVVLIGDEAHHNNTKTMLSKEDIDDNTTWESTIENIVKHAKGSVLLEFTATIDLEDPSIYMKYYDRIIYKYGLKEFRSDGYSKDVLIYHVDSDTKSRMLQAIIISQYRMKVALRNHIHLKPVVMFKSRTIAENKENFELFNSMVNNLTVEQLETQKERALKTDSVLKDALEHIDITLSDLVEELKSDFMPERLILVDGNNISSDKQIKLNSLEDRSNGYRAVFAVDMLNEGWDVLNLFDIVRLYDTRDAKNNKPGKTTIREAQLIGRGARYFPFVTNDPDMKYKRKFDENENEDLRLIEQLHYHSAENPKYIQEIRQALIQTGIMVDGDPVEHVFTLKDSFKKTETYNNGVVYINERRSITEDRFNIGSILPGFDFDTRVVPVDLPTNLGKEKSVFSEEDDEPKDAVVKEHYENKFAKIVPNNILRYAMSRNKAFRFNKLKNSMMIGSTDAFAKIVGQITVQASGIGISKGDFTPDQRLFIAKAVLNEIEAQFSKNQDSYIGTEEFMPKKISEVFKDNIKRKYMIVPGSSDKEFGISQIWDTSKYQLNLNEKDWYVYDDNFGTSEEKSLILTIDGMFEELSKNWSDIYLIRNEKAVTLYSFKDGQAFEPDFVLFANDKVSGNVSWQLFIEPKGNGWLDKDAWKNEFLQEIENKKGVMYIAEHDGAKIVGLPFYNEDEKTEFTDKLANLNAGIKD